MGPSSTGANTKTRISAMGVLIETGTLTTGVLIETGNPEGVLVESRDDPSALLDLIGLPMGNRTGLLASNLSSSLIFSFFFVT